MDKKHENIIKQLNTPQIDPQIDFREYVQDWIGVENIMGDVFEKEYKDKEESDMTLLCKERYENSIKHRSPLELKDKIRICSESSESKSCQLYTSKRGSEECVAASQIKQFKIGAEITSEDKSKHYEIIDSQFVVAISYSEHEHIANIYYTVFRCKETQNVMILFPYGAIVHILFDKNEQLNTALRELIQKMLTNTYEKPADKKYIIFLLVFRPIFQYSTSA